MRNPLSYRPVQFAAGLAGISLAVAAFAGPAGAATASPGPVAHTKATASVAAPKPALGAKVTLQTYTATTSITNRPDSGTKGNNWALDGTAARPLVRTAAVTEHYQVPVANCPGSKTGKCYWWTFTIKDTGAFATIAGQLSPHAGIVLDQSLTGSMSGGTTNGEFFSSWRTANRKLVWKGENDHGLSPAGRHTTGSWVEQFFGPGAVFNSNASPGAPDLGSKAGWSYTLVLGSNKQCKNDSYKWTDAAGNGWGTGPAAGDILTPDSAHC